jgi:hypothetical protein
MASAMTQRSLHFAKAGEYARLAVVMIELRYARQLTYQPNVPASFSCLSGLCTV